MVPMDDLLVENPQIIQMDKVSVLPVGDVPFVDKQVLQRERHIEIDYEMGGHVFDEGEFGQNIALCQNDAAVFSDFLELTGIL
jgi:hypothetical protein